MNTNSIPPREDEEDEEQCRILSFEDEDEPLMPDDHDLRPQRPAPFAYISTPLDLESAVTSFLDDILEDSDFVRNVSQLKSAIKGKTWILNSALGFSLVVRIIAECPVSSHHVSKWVEFSVGILAHANNIDNKNPNLFINYLRPALAVIDRVCVDDIKDMEFHLGLGNLINSFMELDQDSWEIIMNHGDGIKTLSSYIMYPMNRLFSRISEDNFDKLFTLVMRLWATENGLRKPRLSQAVASLVWPLQCGKEVYDTVPGFIKNNILRTP